MRIPCARFLSYFFWGHGIVDLHGFVTLFGRNEQKCRGSFHTTANLAPRKAWLSAQRSDSRLRSVIAPSDYR